MSNANQSKKNAPPQDNSKEGSSALDREAKYVEDITQSKDRDRGDDNAEAARKERTARIEQDEPTRTK